MKSRSCILKILSFSSLSSLAIIISGCSWLFSGRYQEFNDEFRNSKRAITRMLLYPLERSEVGNAYIVFEKEQSPDFVNVKAYCVVSRSSSSFAASKQGFMKIGDQTYELALHDIVSEQKMCTETTSSTYTSSDSTNVLSGSTFETETRNWTDDKFFFIPAMEIIAGISASDDVSLRFYFGPVPATYRIRGHDLNLLKKTLTEYSAMAVE